MKGLINAWKNWKKTVFLGLGILMLAFFLRVYNLTLLPIFGDEAIYIRWSQVMNAVPSLRFLPLSDGKQPLYMWVLMFLVNRFSDPLFIARFTSVLYGIGTLFGVFILSYYLFKSKYISLIASLFWAISPYSIFYDRMALVDSMLTMFGIWTLIFAVITARKLRIDSAMLTGFALGGALLTKSPAIYFVVLLPITWIVSKWPVRKNRKLIGKNELIHLIKLIFLSLITYLIAYGMYNIMRLGENFQLISSRNQDYVFPISHLWTNPLDPFKFNFNNVYDWLWKLGPSVLVVFILLALLAQIKKAGNFKIAKFKRPSPEVALIFIWSIVPILISSIYAKVFTSRYILFSLPTIYIFASLVFVDIYSRERLFNKVLIFGLIIYTLQSLLLNYYLLTDPEKASLPRDARSGFLEEWTAGTGIREISDFVREEYQKNPDVKIVIGTEGYFGTLPDGLQLYLNDLPEIIVIGTGLDFKEVPIQLIESKESGNKTYFVVNSSRLKASPCALGLKLIAAYPKAVKPDKSRETLYLFEVK